jgi:hypothetical protein
VMQSIPTTLEGAAKWPLQLQALRLESVSGFKHMQQRVAKYVHEVMPTEEEAIASEVRRFF